MPGNVLLNAAKRHKKDEFYTQIVDIERELRHYKKHFKDKTVLCNCDDPFESKFFEYFVQNFNKLKLKKLIATCYSGSPVMGGQLSLFDVVPDAEPGTPYKAIVTKVYDITGDGYIDMFDVKELFIKGENELSMLKGDGDFRSQECLDLLDEADIVCTNPPFSLFREYVSTLIEHKKNFLIIGNQNAIKYKEIFPLFQQNKIWLGYGFPGNIGFFESPYEDRAVSSHHIEGLIRVSGVMWFTNLDIKKRHEDLVLVKRFDPDNYPRYVNYDAIEVSRVVDIPCDYAGNMGVPITFMTQYNPEQFEIIGMNWTVLSNAVLSDEIRLHHNVARRLNFYLPTPDGKGNDYSRMYDRVVIRNKHPEPPKG